MNILQFIPDRTQAQKPLPRSTETSARLQRLLNEPLHLRPRRNSPDRSKRIAPFHPPGPNERALHGPRERTLPPPDAARHRERETRVVRRAGDLEGSRTRRQGSSEPVVAVLRLHGPARRGGLQYNNAGARGQEQPKE